MNPTKKRILLPLAVLCLVLLFGVIGCSKSGTVSGKVTYGGEPVKIGTITFHPEKGTAVSVEFENGEYEAKKVPPGPCVVTVSTANQWQAYQAAKSRQQGGGGIMPNVGKGGGAPAMDKMKDKGELKEADKMKEEGEKELKKYEGMQEIPTEYGDKDKSKFKLEVKSGSQEFDVPLEEIKPKKKPQK